jgi:isopentenyl-diphosphate delta-isomerase
MSQVILVDENDKQLGLAEKRSAHLAKGKLHRAISVLLFNPQGELLIQQRSQSKMLWPGFWANTCCSHPHANESYQQAAERRLKEEFGIQAQLKFHHKFIYQASYKDIGSEYEMCAVFTGVSAARPRPNQAEIAAWKYIDLETLRQDIKRRPQRYGPWFKLELKRIKASDILGS